MIWEPGFADSPLTPEFSGRKLPSRAIRAGVAECAGIALLPARTAASTSEPKKMAERIDLRAGKWIIAHRTVRLIELRRSHSIIKGHPSDGDCIVCNLG